MNFMPPPASMYETVVEKTRLVHGVRVTSQGGSAREHEEMAAVLDALPAAGRQAIISVVRNGTHCDIELRRCDRPTGLAIGPAFAQVCGSDSYDIAINGVCLCDVERSFGHAVEPDHQGVGRPLGGSVAAPELRNATC